MKIAIYILSFLTTGHLAFWLSENASAAKDPFSSEKPYDQDVPSLDMPANLNFCGEAVPLDKYWVYEAMDRELSVNVYWHSNTLLALKATRRYFPTIERIMAEEGVPSDLKYIPLAESAFRNETSPDGARGFWQLMKETAKERGLEINEYVDERNNLELSTRTACKLLKQCYNAFGNWTLAAAAYNSGMGTIRKQINLQKQDSFYDLHLYTETWRYVYRLLAFKALVENPDRYGFRIADSQYYPEVSTAQVEVQQISDIATFAATYGTNYKQIKMLNPWIIDTSLPLNKTGKSYTIKIPRL